MFTVANRVNSVSAPMMGLGCKHLAVGSRLAAEFHWILPSKYKQSKAKGFGEDFILASSGCKVMSFQTLGLLSKGKQIMWRFGVISESSTRAVCEACSLGQASWTPRS